MTRSQTPEAALDHVLKAIGYDSQDPVTLGLKDAGINSITDLQLLGEKDLKSLESLHSSPDPSTGTVTTRRVRLGIIPVKRILAAMEWFHMTDNTDHQTWFLLSETIFLDFVNKGGPNLGSGGSAPTPSNTLESTQPTTIPSSGDASDFTKGVKRSISDYPKLQEDKFWLSFHRKLRATAAMHGVSEVLDPQYTAPPGTEELFKSKSQFIYSVFVSHLNTSKSRRIVRKFSDILDGQATYILLKKEYSGGATAEIAINKLRDEILKMRLDNNWSKPLETFLDHWESKVEDLEDLQDSSVPDDRKMEWLSTTIKPHSELYRTIFESKIITSTLGVLNASQKQLSFDQLFKLIREHATQIDSLNGNKKKNNKNSERKVNNANRGNQQKSQQNQYSPGKDYSKDTRNFVPKQEWIKMTQKQKNDFWDAKRARKQNKNQRNVNKSQTQPNDQDSSQNPPEVQPDGNPPGSAIRRMLSNAQSTPASQPMQTIMYQGKVYKLAATNIKYRFNNAHVSQVGSLIDSGANGGLAGDDVRVLETSFQKADVAGIGESNITGLNLCTVAGVIQTTTGPIVGIFHQYANYGSGKTIHSANQMASFGLDVNERPKHLIGGRQSIVTQEGFVIPLAIRQGLAYMDMHPPTDEELDLLEHVVFTSDQEWDPSQMDREVELEGGAENGENGGSDEVDDENLDLNVNEVRRPQPENQLLTVGPIIPQTEKPKEKPKMPYQPKCVLSADVDIGELRPNFGWIPEERIKNTLKCTIQWYRMSQRYPMRKHYRSRFPAANVNRLHDTVATDRLFSDTPAHDDGITGHGGATMVQVYVGAETRLTEAYPMSSENQMAGTLQEFIQKHGAPDVLMSDNAKAEIGNKVLDILRNYHIADHQSEPHYQNQNPAERRIQDIKRTTNNVMDRTGWDTCQVLAHLHLVCHHVVQPSGSRNCWWCDTPSGCTWSAT